MRKYLLALAVGLLAASLAAPASAADFKYTGIFRLRGMTYDNMDRNDKAHDGGQFYDNLVRPRWTATSEGGKIVAIYELDATQTNFGESSSDPATQVNRWTIDFAIPGTTLRGRVGRSDYTDPTNEIFDSVGAHRQDGIAVYGKLFGPVSLSAFTTKLSEGGTAATDTENYYVALAWKAAPNVTLTPWFAISRRNGTTAATDYTVEFYALHGHAKLGILDIQVQGIVQGGTASESHTAGVRDVDQEAWALMIRSWLTFGKLKIGLYYSYLSGDDDGTSQTSQPDNKYKRFLFPNASGYFNGPNILHGARFSTVVNNGAIAGNAVSSRNVGRTNGYNTPEILFHYQLTPALNLEGGVSFVYAAEKAASTGVKSDKNFGTVYELGFRWSIYKQLVLWVQGSYISAGDYGMSSTPGTRGWDDTWAIYYEFRHTW